ncbi:MAG: type I-U CRISPR-associated helicase/endonuclease Cas3 [Planctomycetes bacterium]|nr:type I-U CRISPR-associated helicase/endonuclease Cas3 [Planctomycetota bacterium]
MADLMPDQFSEFFETVHSTVKEPKQLFEWQKRLAGEVLGNRRWPDVIRIPTGCGKTSVLDLALFELALQSSRKAEERTAPRRVCFVIDRRLVVDEVTEHARRIQRAVRAAVVDSSAAPVVRAVAERLRGLAPDGGEPLRLVRLRGGVYRDDGWAGDPLTPTILVSTVDQIGSRLLFRGYGVSRRNLPVHAGLLAFDTRIILDEAHLSTVFAETLDRVRRYQKLAEASPLPEGRMLSIVRMSATAGEGGRPFDLLPDERIDMRLRPRIEACKLAELIEVKVEPVTKKLRQEQPAKAREQEKHNRRELVERIVREARRRAGVDREAATNSPRVIGVVVNRVATARQVFNELQKTDEQASKLNALLLTGRIRPFDRDRLLEQWLPRIRANREQEPQETLFVVATQTVEVGANLDFDALVTEAAPLDALRQRFGRLDRLGKRHQRGTPSPASIVVRSDQAKKSDDDRVYGSAIADTWKWLQKIASTTGKGAAKRVAVDFGVNLLDAKLPEDPCAMGPMLAPRPESPVLFPAHLDAWVQTNPHPEPDPDVAPFLHGRADTPADVQLIWRADLDPDRRSSWAAIVSLTPPLTREALPVPIYAVRAWLRGVAAADVADVEGAQAEASGLPAKRDEERQVLRWRGKDDAKVVGPDDVKPGDTIVVPARYGGADPFGWHPTRTDAVEDVADRCLAQLIASYPDDAFRRPKLRLRLHPDLMPPTDDATHARLRSLLGAAAAATCSEAEYAAWPMVARLLAAIEPLATDAFVCAAIQALITHRGRVESYPGQKGVVVIASVAVTLVKPSLPEDETEHDEPEGDEASFTGRQVFLDEHLESVSRTARAFATGCGLAKKLAETVELAGRWHDQGKRDRRFQAWLRGSELQALAEGEPIAKSGRDVSQWKPSTLFGYPRGARHEFVSIRLFEQAGSQTGDGSLLDLVKFLIGTHHGFGRPFPPVVKDRSPVEVKLVLEGREMAVSSDHRLHRLDSGWTDLFWRMVRRFGWWGLTYLEALLVTADRTVSARERQKKKKRDAAAEAVA